MSSQITEPAPTGRWHDRHRLANSRLLTLAQKLAFVDNYDTEDREAILAILDTEREQLLALIRATGG